MVDVGMQGKTFNGSVLNQSHLETCNQILLLALVNPYNITLLHSA